MGISILQFVVIKNGFKTSNSRTYFYLMLVLYKLEFSNHDIILIYNYLSIQSTINPDTPSSTP